MTRRLVTAISVIHHLNHSWTRRATATSASAQAVLPESRQGPRFAEPVRDRRQERNPNAGPVHDPMNRRDVPDLLTRLQDALHVAHNNGSPPPHRIANPPNCANGPCSSGAAA